MGSRIKTFTATGVAPSGRLFAGDLNAIQDQYADLTNLSQALSVGSLVIGESGLQLLRFGSLEARITGALRIDGIFRPLGGMVPPSFTTTTRNAIAAGSRPYGMLILNTTTNQYEWNSGTDASPTWIAVSPPAGVVGTAGIADGAVTSIKIADGTIVAGDIDGSLKPSVAALAGTEALRALGTTAATAAAGNDARLSDTRTPTAGSVTATEVNASLKPSGSAAAGTEALRALGTGANNAAAGNDARLTDQRTPVDLSVTAAKIAPEAVSTKSTNYTPVLADRFTLIYINAALTITLPSDATAAFNVGDSIDFMQTTAGQGTFAAGSGAALGSFASMFKTAGQYAMVTAIKTSTNTWILVGNLTP